MKGEMRRKWNNRRNIEIMAKKIIEENEIMYHHESSGGEMANEKRRRMASAIIANESVSAMANIEESRIAKMKSNQWRNQRNMAENVAAKGK